MALKIKIPTQIWSKTFFCTLVHFPFSLVHSFKRANPLWKSWQQHFFAQKEKRKDRKEKEKKETHRLHWKPDETLSRSFERQKTTIYFSFELLASFPLRSDLLLWGDYFIAFQFQEKIILLSQGVKKLLDI